MTATSEAAVTPESFAPSPGKRWYVVHAYSGMEKAVERNLRERIDRSELKEKFGRILVPMEEVVELKNGKKSVSERRFFPGYVLVKCDLTDEVYHLIKNTPKVTGFLGADKAKPVPIPDSEAERIKGQVAEGIERNGVMAKLGEQGIASKPYLPSIHMQPYWRERFGTKEGMFPVSEETSRRSLALPFHTRLERADQTSDLELAHHRGQVRQRRAAWQRRP